MPTEAIAKTLRMVIIKENECNSIRLGISLCCRLKKNLMITDKHQSLYIIQDYSRLSRIYCPIR
jgi:hypothetical protein